MLSRKGVAPFFLLAACLFGAVALLGSYLVMAAAQESRQIERPRNLSRGEIQPSDPATSPTPVDPALAAATSPGPVPKEDQLYVWPVPEKGTQSILVLRVIDGDTCEGAFLVPAVFRLRGINAPEMRDKGGRPAKEYLEKLLTGKLYSANLFGREKFGRILADFYLGKDQGWSSEAMIKAGHATPYGGGKRESQRE